MRPRKTGISEVRFLAVVRCFCRDLTATATAELTGLSLRSVNAIFLALRRRLAEHCVCHPTPAGEAGSSPGNAGHPRIHQGEDRLVGNRHSNGNNRFWRYAEHRLAKFNGLSKRSYHLHLKECEFRFNHRHDNLYQVVLELLRSQSL